MHAAIRADIPTIAIVDDHPVVREAYADLFAAGGFQVSISCSTGEQLLAHLRAQGACDLIVVDLHLVGMDGFTLLRHLALEYPGIRTVALSFEGGGTHVRHAFLCGARAYITKDMDRQVVLEVVHSVHKFGSAPEMMAHGPPPSAPLDLAVIPDREKEYLDLLATLEDPSDKRVAEHMGISIARVAAMFQYFRKRFGVPSRLGLLRRVLFWRRRDTHK